MLVDVAHDGAGEDHGEHQEDGHHDGDDAEQRAVLLDKVLHLLEAAACIGTAGARRPCTAEVPV